MKTTSVIIKANGQFLAETRHDGQAVAYTYRWVSEYPEATEFTNLIHARRYLRGMRARGEAFSAYRVIGYGLTSEERFRI